MTERLIKGIECYKVYQNEILDIIKDKGWIRKDNLEQMLRNKPETHDIQHDKKSFILSSAADPSIKIPLYKIMVKIGLIQEKADVIQGKGVFFYYKI